MIDDEAVDGDLEINDAFGLDLRLLIAAEDDGVGRRIDIKADDVQVCCTEVRLPRATLAIPRPVQ